MKKFLFFVLLQCVLGDETKKIDLRTIEKYKIKSDLAVNSRNDLIKDANDFAFLIHEFIHYIDEFITDYFLPDSNTKIDISNEEVKEIYQKFAFLNTLYTIKQEKCENIEQIKCLYENVYTLNETGQKLLGFEFRNMLRYPEFAKILSGPICIQFYNIFKFDKYDQTKFCDLIEKFTFAASEMLVIADQHSLQEERDWDPDFSRFFLQYNTSVYDSNETNNHNQKEDDTQVGSPEELYKIENKNKTENNNPVDQSKNKKNSETERKKSQIDRAHLLELAKKKYKQDEIPKITGKSKIDEFKKLDSDINKLEKRADHVHEIQRNGTLEQKKQLKEQLTEFLQFLNRWTICREQYSTISEQLLLHWYNSPYHKWTLIYPLANFMILEYLIQA